MEYIVDVQGFKSSSNKFIFKEVAITAVEDDATPMVFTFQPPYDWKSLPAEYKVINQWLETHLHGIPWSSGGVPYEKLTETLQESLKEAKKVWVKGLEKKKWVQELLTNKLVCNLEDNGCPSLSALSKGEEEILFYCSYHKLCMIPVCAFVNIKKLKKWLIQSRRPPVTHHHHYHEGVDEVDVNCSISMFNTLAIASRHNDIETEIHHSMYT